MELRPVQFNILRYQASFRRRARARWLSAAVSRLVANTWKSACLTPVQALPGFVALSHDNPKIALPQTAKCGSRSTSLPGSGASNYARNRADGGGMITGMINRVARTARMGAQVSRLCVYVKWPDFAGFVVRGCLERGSGGPSRQASEHQA